MGISKNKNQIKKRIKQASSRDWGKTIDAIEDWITIIDLDSKILRSNRTVSKYFQIPVQQVIGIKCCKLLHGTDRKIKGCPMSKMLRTKKRESVEFEMKDGRWMLITVDPIFDDSREISSAVHIARDITLRILIQREREKLVSELKKALTQIKTLSGLLPICSNCKKIRDDKGYWNLIESYVENHSDAVFSHGICPECSDRLYSDQKWYIDMKKKKRNKT